MVYQKRWFESYSILRLIMILFADTACIICDMFVSALPNRIYYNDDGLNMMMPSTSIVPVTPSKLQSLFFLRSNTFNSVLSELFHAT